MPIDTRSKRASVLGVAMAITLTLPLADGTVASADRQSTAYCYSGISTSVGQAVTWTILQVVDAAWTVATGVASAWTVATGADDDLVT